MRLNRLLKLPLGAKKECESSCLPTMRPAEALTTCTKAAAGTRAHPVAAFFLFNFAFQVVLVFHPKLHTMNPAEPSPEAAIGCQKGIRTIALTDHATGRGAHHMYQDRC